MKFTRIKKAITTLLCAGLITACLPAVTKQEVSAASSDFAKGADISWVPALEAQGYTWYDSDGNEKDILELLKEDYDMDSIRLRVFVNPSDDYGNGWCDLENTVAMAKRANELGMRIMIDFHYSDTFADPGTQTKPAAWEDYSVSELTTAVYDHTYEVMSALADEGIYPEWVQVGNEVNNGMLWDDGMATNGFDNFAAFLNAGYSAVKAVSSNSKVVLHLSSGQDTSVFEWVCEGLTEAGGNFDVVGMSLYPTKYTWQSYVDNAYDTMSTIQSTYGKEVMVCECGMDYTDEDECQDFISKLCYKTESLGGLGVFYWEPEAYPEYNGYEKSACGSDGKLTSALEGFSDTNIANGSSIEAVTSTTNLLTNPGFETDASSTLTPTGWSKWYSSSSYKAASFVEWSGYSGSYKLTHYSSSAYNVSTYQNVTGLTNGTYAVKAMVMCSGGQDTCELYVRNYGGSEITADLPATNTWVQIVIEGITVTNGKAQIGILSDASAGNWCNVDDVEFFKVN